MAKKKINKEKLGNRYSQIIEKIFAAHFKPGLQEFVFERDEIVQVAGRLGINLPKNLGDLIYTFRYRASLPAAIIKKAPEGKVWIIQPVGPGKYRFLATVLSMITPSDNLVETKIPDATPGIISMYAFSDEQALLAKLRYNRMIDIFTGVACYSLQSHLRTSVKSLGQSQIEIDEVYIGVDKRGAHFILPVQAKGHKDRISVVQIEQDYAMCQEKFPSLVCRPIAAQFMRRDLIALFEFEREFSGMAVSSEKHYRLVEPEEIQASDLETYKNRSSE